LAGRLEIRVVGQRRIAADLEEVLHPALGGQAVVVPAHRVDHRLAAHPLEPRDQVGVRVREEAAQVQGPGYGGRRGGDRVYARPVRLTRSHTASPSTVQPLASSETPRVTTVTIVARPCGERSKHSLAQALSSAQTSRTPASYCTANSTWTRALSWKSPSTRVS